MALELEAAEQERLAAERDRESAANARLAADLIVGEAAAGWNASLQELKEGLARIESAPRPTSAVRNPPPADGHRTGRRPPRPPTARPPTACAPAAPPPVNDRAKLAAEKHKQRLAAGASKGAPRCA